MQLDTLKHVDAILADTLLTGIYKAANLGEASVFACRWWADIQ